MSASALRRTLRVTVLTCTVALVGGACGGDAAPKSGIKSLKVAGLGSQLLDLTVQPETRG